MTWDSSSQYSKDKLQNMQKEAIERVQEMQRRANAALKNAQQDPAFYSTPQPHSPRSSQTNDQGRGGNFQNRGPNPYSQNDTRPSLSSNQSQQSHQSNQSSQPSKNTYHNGGGNPSRNINSPQVPKSSQVKEESNQEHAEEDTHNNKDFVEPDSVSYEEIPIEEDPTPVGGLSSILNGFLSGLGLAPSPQGRDTLPKLLKALNLDNERLLILLLVFLLYSDGADYTLLFALLYLFL